MKQDLIESLRESVEVYWHTWNEKQPPPKGTLRCVLRSTNQLYFTCQKTGLQICQLLLATLNKAETRKLTAEKSRKTFKLQILKVNKRNMLILR